MKNKLCNSNKLYRVLIFFNYYYSLFIPISILANLYFANKCPKLGIQIRNNGYGNHIFHISMVVFNLIERIRIPKYILDSITLFYRNVSFSMGLRECAMYNDIWECPSLLLNSIESYLNKVQIYATSTSTSTPTLFKLLITSQFLRAKFPHKESTQQHIIYLTWAPPSASAFLCWLLFLIQSDSTFLIWLSFSD